MYVYFFGSDDSIQIFEQNGKDAKRRSSQESTSARNSIAMINSKSSIGKDVMKKKTCEGFVAASLSIY